MTRKPRQTEVKGKQSTANKQDERSATNGRQSAAGLKRRHGSELRPGERIGPLLTPGIAGFWNYSDAALLRFVAEFISYNFSAPRDITSQDALDLAEAVIIAETVEAAADFGRGFRFPLPGLASYRTHTVAETLEHLATLWHRSQAEWRRLDRAGNADDPEVEVNVCGLVSIQHLWFYWAQVTFVCEAVLVRAGVLEEMDYETPAHREAQRHYAAALRLAAESAPEVIAHLAPARAA